MEDLLNQLKQHFNDNRLDNKNVDKVEVLPNDKVDVLLNNTECNLELRHSAIEMLNKIGVENHGQEQRSQEKQEGEVDVGNGIEKPKRKTRKRQTAKQQVLLGSRG